MRLFLCMQSLVFVHAVTLLLSRLKYGSACSHIVTFSAEIWQCGWWVKGRCLVLCVPCYGFPSYDPSGCMPIINSRQVVSFTLTIANAIEDGWVQVGGMLELPEQRVTKKVKSLQVFRRPVTSCQQVGSLAVLQPFLQTSLLTSHMAPAFTLTTLL